MSFVQRIRLCQGRISAKIVSNRLAWGESDGARARLRVVWINTHIPFASEMPHSGFKNSGYGKDLSSYGLDDYTRVKHVMSSLD
jgi:acyl-CoA reductase-like NAD-dependent aldehyde dehydrogenase